MHRALYLTATGPRTGKRAIALGTMSILSRNMQDVAIFRPIINEPQLDDRAPDINLLLEHFKLKQDYCDTFAYTYQEVRTIINQGDRNLVIENIIQKFKELQSRHDFVLCVGTDFLGKDPVFEFELNAEIASNLGCPVMLITSGEGKTAEDVRDSLLVTRDSMAPYSLDVIATIVNRASLTRAEADDLSDIFAVDGKPGLVYAIPDEPALGRATMRDLQKGLNAEVLSGEAHLDALVGDYLIAAMHVDNFLGYLAKDQLIVTPGDRTDILLASIASRLSSSKPDIAGVLLTGGIRPSAEVSSLIEGWTGAPLPVLLTDQHTSKAFMSLQEIYGLIEPTDTRKINTVLGLYDHYVNGKEISARLNMTKPGRMTPMMFELNLIERAKAHKMRIVLAEGEEPRILQATDILLRREVADIILLGNEDKINKLARELHLDVSKATIIDPTTSPKFEDYAATYAELRKAKGVTIERARDVMSDATYFATMMVKKDDADGMVSGAVNTTAHTIRPAFEFIKTKPGYSVVSSVFLMCLKDRVLVFGDCAVNPNPTSQQLAEIAVASADTAKVFGIDPKVAFLSYSTLGSGKGEDVDKMRNACEKAKAAMPDVPVDGEFQFDAAVSPVVAKTKHITSSVGGHANTFIFPDINAGNIGYKICQRMGNFDAYGPILQGLNAPINDLSRGCNALEVYSMAIITAGLVD